ncbi:UDP-GlcNAc:betaGal beta-1,3-N-acetylglucosaminyltransferase 7-like [Conger conger]|nr:UDP-GlcNAc:betaGal beta-1,3-N-acetylglucosaminyltransferase 7-like [Conger conger]
MTARDRWRMYKRVSMMFFLAVVTLTVVQRGNINTGVPFQLEREAEKEPTISKRALLKKDHFQESRNVWNTSIEAITEKQGETEYGGSRTWDVASTNCTANPNFNNMGWFVGLEANFKQFLLYRHCRYFPMIINHPEKCSGETYLLIVIKSTITQHDRRDIIRKTWGREQEVDGKRVKTLFLLGKSSNELEKAHHQKLLEYEDYIYGDILQWDFLDSFFNLTLKETHFLKWFATYCGRVSYIFKGDDDVFVSIHNIFEYLEGTSADNLLVGDVLFKAKPIRRKENKYYIPQALYNKTHYPPYAGGGGFLMDGTLARKLNRASETLDLFPIDDVFLGMCLEVLRISPIKHNAFKTFGLVKSKSSRLNREPCFFKSMIVVHKLLPADLLNMWRLVNSDLICSQKAILL